MIIKTEDVLNPGNVVLQTLILSELSEGKVNADVLRLDKIHPILSGNKWFKLKYYLKDAREKQYDTLLTFGGAWSNHIIASAYLSKLYGLRVIGVIRGEKPQKSSQTLNDAIDLGMNLEFVTRTEYTSRNHEGFKQFLEEKFGRVYFIPEGGAGALGIKGSAEILDVINTESYSHIICCMGTGTMFHGLANKSLPHQGVIGIPVLKGEGFTIEHFTKDRQKKDNLKIINDYHFGGYAKKTSDLIRFMNNFYLKTGIPSDFVYTGKLFFGFSDLLAKKYFPEGSKILLIHSGGLQGNASLPKGTLLF